MERFWAKVDKNGPIPAHAPHLGACWCWLGIRNHNGYGRFGAGSRTRRNTPAHRWAYEHFVGPIPSGLQIDHLCRVRHCVNPAHLEPVTAAENARRALTPWHLNAIKTHCDNGHEFTEANTYMRHRGGTGTRMCRQCRRERMRLYRAVARDGRQAA